jgi:hypothetical protein
MLRFVHVVYILKALSRTLELFIKASKLRVARYAYTVLLVAHWTACAWFYIGERGFSSSSSTTSQSWLANDGLDLEVGDVFRKYVRSVHYTIGTITTVGYGDITPTNTEETGFAVGLCLISLACYSMLVSIVESMLKNEDVHTGRYYKLKRDTRRFLEKKHGRCSHVTPFRVLCSHIMQCLTSYALHLLIIPPHIAVAPDLKARIMQTLLCITFLPSRHFLTSFIVFFSSSPCLQLRPI